MNSLKILRMHPESFSANVYGTRPFRMIGLIDVDIEYIYGVETVTLAYFRSSGTNSGKIKGLWYPIVGIKTYSGDFTEFSDYTNFALTNTTFQGKANRGWLAKSIFFYNKVSPNMIRGFSSGKHYEKLLDIGKNLRDMYENNDFYLMNSLNAQMLNEIIFSDEIYEGNNHSQRYNFDMFIQDIFNGN